VPAGVGGRVSPVHQLGEERASLLALDDASESRILARQADTGVAHDGHEKPGLAERKAEARDGLNAIGRAHTKSLAKFGSNELPPLHRALDARKHVNPDFEAAAPCPPR